MKKIILLSAIALVSITSIQAQELTFGIKGGVNLASIGGDSFGDVGDLGGAEGVSLTDKGRIAFHLGAIAEYLLTDEFGVQGELLYSSVGGKTEGSASQGDISATVESVSSFNYLSLPIIGKYFVTEEIALEAGPSFNFLLSAKNETTSTLSGAGDADFSETDTETSTEGLNGLDLGFGLGGSYNTEGGLFFGLRYNIGLSNIAKDAGGSFKATNNVLQVSAGYKFN